MPKKPIPNTSRFVLAFVAVALAAAAFAAWLTPTRLGRPLIGGPFALQSADGRTLTEKDMLGHPFLVYFGYTHCPDICPTTLAQISDVLDKLPDKEINALFITVDPERDTPQSMGDYVSSFDHRLVGLSGSREEISKDEQEFHVYAKKGPEKDGEYAIDHSSVVYLMDRRGRFVEPFNLERSAIEAANELQSYY